MDHLVGVAKDFVVSLLVLGCNQQICIVFHWDKLVLLELSLFNVIEGHYLVIAKCLSDNFPELAWIYFGSVGWAACEIIEDIAHFQLMKAQVLLVQLCIGFLKQINPYLIGSTGRKLRLTQRLTWNEVIYCNTLPLPILAEPETIYSRVIYSILIEEESFDERRIDKGKTAYDRVERIVSKFALKEVVMVHLLLEGEFLIDVVGPPPVVNCIINQILVCEPDDGGLIRGKLTVDELDLGLLEYLGDLFDGGQVDVDLLEDCIHHALLALDG